MNTNETIEDIILRYSGRGMDLLRPALPIDFCHRAARMLLELPRETVLLATGFCVSGAAETDGPAGTFSVASALKTLGFRPVILTDEFCRGLFEEEKFETIYFPMNGQLKDALQILEDYRPVCLFSLERCGLNMLGDYRNMRGKSIREKTAPLDLLFMAARGRIPTIGVGDGGNEIGMGNVAGLIAQKLSLIPCIVPVDELVIATVSNWGGYGICACMQKMSGIPLMPTEKMVLSFLERGEAQGYVDGISGLPAMTEDGFPTETTCEILSALWKAAEI